jgi:signal transduction histidine kinase
MSKTGSFIVDVVGDDHNWSEETYRIFEFEPGTKVTLQRIREVVHPADLPSFEAAAERALAGADVQFAFRIVTARGAVKHLRGVAHVVERIEGRPILVGALQDVTESIRAERARRRAHGRALRARLDGVLEERTRVARELHDGLLQGLIGIVLQLDGLHASLARASAAGADELARILSQAHGALAEARQSVWDMRSLSPGHRPLGDTLREVGRGVVTGEVPQVHYAVHGTPPRSLDPRVEATVLHVGREAMRNAVHHAHARAVDVELTHTPDGVTLVVADDGVGMAPEQLDGASARGHFGVLGMRERAARAGGALDVVTAPGAGTRVVLRLPAVAERPSERPDERAESTGREERSLVRAAVATAVTLASGLRPRTDGDRGGA